MGARELAGRPVVVIGSGPPPLDVDGLRAALVTTGSRGIFCEATPDGERRALMTLRARLLAAGGVRRSLALVLSPTRFAVRLLTTVPFAGVVLVGDEAALRELGDPGRTRSRSPTRPHRRPLSPTRSSPDRRPTRLPGTCLPRPGALSPRRRGAPVSSSSG